MSYKVNANAVLISIGREILRGETLDRDSHFLAKNLTRHGVKVVCMTVVDDEPDAIGEEIRRALRRKPRFIFTTGGLGPTFDDKTVASVARTLHLPLRIDPQALAMVRGYYEEMKKGKVVSDSRLGKERKKMAKLPRGASALQNREGAAPGVAIQKGKTTLYLLPGVPPEMKSIFRHEILPLLRGRREKQFAVDVPVKTKDESKLSPLIDKVMKRHPGVYFKSRVRGTKNGIRIVVSLYGDSKAKVDRAAEQLAAKIKNVR